MVRAEIVSARGDEWDGAYTARDMYDAFVVGAGRGAGILNLIAHASGDTTRLIVGLAAMVIGLVGGSGYIVRRKLRPVPN